MATIMEKGKKRKLLLLIPVFLIPVILLWSIINPGKKKPDTDQTQNAFNDKLPSANLKESGKNKLEIYMQAQQDSLKMKEQKQNDPYAKKLYDPAPSPQDSVVSNDPSSLTEKLQPGWNKEDANEKKVNDRLNKLMTALNSNTSTDRSLNAPYTESPFLKNDSNVERLEKMLSALKDVDTTDNPEMKQLEAMLDKILDIQHPERVKERSNTKKMEPEKDTLRLPITTYQQSPAINFYSNAASGGDNSFWNLQTQSFSNDNTSQTFLAVIHENQKVEDGQVSKLRLLQDLYVNNVLIPKGQFVFGKCQIVNGRMNILIEDIAYNNRIYPVQLTIYDQSDGIQGVNIQGSISEQVTKDGVDQLIQQMQMNSMTSSIGVQAATSGIQTAKNLLSKKVKKVSVYLKAGHVVLLKPAQL